MHTMPYKQHSDRKKHTQGPSCEVSEKRARFRQSKLAKGHQRSAREYPKKAWSGSRECEQRILTKPCARADASPENFYLVQGFMLQLAQAAGHHILPCNLRHADRHLSSRIITETMTRACPSRRHLTPTRKNKKNDMKPSKVYLQKLHCCISTS